MASRLLTVLAPLLILEVGCAKTLITSRAPDRSATVRVTQFCGPPDCRVDIYVQRGWWDEKIVDTRYDCIVNFAHVAWSADSRVAAIFVDNGFCSGIREGYDLTKESLVPFEPLADLVRQSIVKEYGVHPSDLAPYGGDPLEWAHDSGDGIVRPGVEAFRRKYGPDTWP